MVALRFRIKSPLQAGFTLVELSIVLVIIGLIIGGVLVGQDLISAASVRAQISQIEKYNAAVNTFRGKYGYLPGDMPDPYATQFGFAPRGTNPVGGNGDGNGLIEGTNGGACDYCQDAGETTLFWNDLTYANGQNLNMISGSFTNANLTWAPNPPAVSGPDIAQWLPAAVIGGGNYIAVYSGGWGIMADGPPPTNDGYNYFSLAYVVNINEWDMQAQAGLTVSQAYNIDKKIDDGLPQTGTVTTFYLSYVGNWAEGGGGYGMFNHLTGAPSNFPTAATATSCYDNNGVNGGQQHYSMEMNNGMGVNCALSFRLQ